MARGKIQLVQALLAGDLESSDNLMHLLSRCLVCGSCQEACPAEVKVTEIILRARNELVRARALAEVGGKTSFPSVSRWARFLQTTRSWAVQPLPAVIGLLSEIHRQMSPIGLPKSLIEKVVMKTGSSDSRMKVGYFPGCAESIYPRVGRAVLRVLEKNGIQSVIPQGLSCCGVPFLEAGDFSTARRMAEANVKAFEGEDLEAIVVGCSSCGRALKRDYRELLVLPGFSVPVYHMAEFLMDVLPSHEEFSPLPLKVTFLNSQGLSQGCEWHRKLLAGIQGLELVELETSEQSCGESLFFSAVHPDLFRKILERKLEVIAEMGCNAVITDSLVCRIQLEWALKSRGMPIRVMHLAEILAWVWEVGESSSVDAEPGTAARKRS